MIIYNVNTDVRPKVESNNISNTSDISTISSNNMSEIGSNGPGIVLSLINTSSLSNNQIAGIYSSLQSLLNIKKNFTVNIFLDSILSKIAQIPKLDLSAINEIARMIEEQANKLKSTANNITNKVNNIANTVSEIYKYTLISFYALMLITSINIIIFSFFPKLNEITIVLISILFLELIIFICITIFSWKTFTALNIIAIILFSLVFIISLSIWFCLYVYV